MASLAFRDPGAICLGMGRKPLGETVMTSAERQRRSREKRREARAANAHRLEAYRFEQLIHRVVRELEGVERRLTEQGIESFKRKETRLDLLDAAALGKFWQCCRSARRALTDLLRTAKTRGEATKAPPEARRCCR